MNIEMAFGRFVDNSDSNPSAYFAFLKIDYYLPFEIVEIFVSVFNNICLRLSGSYGRSPSHFQFNLFHVQPIGSLFLYFLKQQK